ncbi:MAG: phosphoribosylglycinamide formyltransferase [Gemmatimonadota bacterium]|nr:MAG: phosphoribosylglycinamide formyltransferase [Gemmatimonadota bacterium]
MTLPIPVAVFASGGGTNLQALLDREDGGAAYRIALVVSDRPDAGALERARKAGRGAVVIPVKDRPLEEVESEILDALRGDHIEMVLLAGYLRLVPLGVVRAFERRMLNVHPALLPAFGGAGMWGMHVHRAVLEAGVDTSGLTVHFVAEDYDTGSILAQWPVPVLPGDDAETLARRILRVEHSLYPEAADYLARAIAEDRESQTLGLLGDGAPAVPELDDAELARVIRAAVHGH